MRIILSRKGFDSANGGCASPIFPDGRLLSLPIPSEGALIRYRDIGFDGGSLGDIVEAVTRGKVAAEAPAHLDPDLDRSARSRLPGWRPAFGQIEAAQSHLREQGVGQGDLFLFFGWFREVVEVGGSWSFKQGSQDLHVLFGWLQVDEAADLNRGSQRVVEKYPWLAGHPHLHTRKLPNTIYIASKQLTLPADGPSTVPGAGLFRAVAPELILTRPGQRLRSSWLLPHWFAPKGGKGPLTYHREAWRWSPDEHGTRLATVGRGQEFVLDCDDFPEAIGWVRTLLARHGKR